MAYSFLAWIAKWEVILFSGALAGIISMRLLTGKINTRYLLYGTNADGSRYFSPLRVQLLVATLLVALQYLTDASSQGKMPVLPDGALQLLGASNAIYLGGKALAFFKNTLPMEGENQ